MIDRDTILSFLFGVCLALAFVGCMFGIQTISASPYQLNLSTGQLIDLGTGNDTANITIYVLPNITNIVTNNITYTNYTNYTNLTTFQNISWTNITNITNVTCVNCTNNYTYNNDTHTSIYNYTMNGTSWNGSFYNITEADGRFAGKTDYNSFISAVANDFNILSNRINAVNSSIESGTKEDTSGHIGLWIIGGCAILLSIGAIYLAKKAEEGL